MHGNGGNLGLVDQLLIAMGIGQQHAVLVKTADGPLQLMPLTRKMATWLRFCATS